MTENTPESDGTEQEVGATIQEAKPEWESALTDELLVIAVFTAAVLSVVVGTLLVIGIPSYL